MHLESTGARDNLLDTNTANKDRLGNPGIFPETRHDNYLEQQRAQTSIVRVCNHSSISPWDGSVKAGEILEATFRVFEVQITA